MLDMYVLSVVILDIPLVTQESIGEMQAHLISLIVWVCNTYAT